MLVLTIAGTILSAIYIYYQLRVVSRRGAPRIDSEDIATSPTWRDLQDAANGHGFALSEADYCCTRRGSSSSGFRMSALGHHKRNNSLDLEIAPVSESISTANLT
jgi:hypothetical protein